MESTQIAKRLKNLETHLEKENPVLREAVSSFRELDSVGRQLGLLSNDQSYATRLSWWPMIAVMGTFSAGKSSFINRHLGHKLQRTGNHAVDDKFTVITYSSGEMATLPGTALDADPRFPFYQISNSIQEIVTTGGQRIDVYLQLKTCPSDKLKGKILIDSPGFDADQQRTSILRITRHIIDLSDLVLVFFDARHPEAGAMQDTLMHLVEEAIQRPDSNKFLYILNQIDVTAREDNPEEVVGAWQRALSSKGLTAGRFYRIYNPEAAVPIESPEVRKRFEDKLEEDMLEINQRMDNISIDRAYRVIDTLEQTAKDIETHYVPKLQNYIQCWKKRTFWGDVIGLVLLCVIFGAIFGTNGWMPSLPADPVMLWGGVAVIAAVLAFLHVKISGIAAKGIAQQIIQEESKDEMAAESLLNAFRKNSGAGRALFMPLFSSTPLGWGNAARQRLESVIDDTNSYTQKLTDTFTKGEQKAD